MKPDLQNKSDWLKQYRQSQGLTQKALAELLGVNVRRIEAWEQAESPVPEWAIKFISCLDATTH
jgi:transcriptional regulator with XRE-family HTH domain